MFRVSRDSHYVRLYVKTTKESIAGFRSSPNDRAAILCTFQVHRWEAVAPQSVGQNRPDLFRDSRDSYYVRLYVKTTKESIAGLRSSPNDRAANLCPFQVHLWEAVAPQSEGRTPPELFRVSRDSYYVRLYVKTTKESIAGLRSSPNDRAANLCPFQVLLFLMIRPQPRSPILPYTSLFRSDSYYVRLYVKTTKESIAGLRSSPNDRAANLCPFQVHLWEA